MSVRGEEELDGLAAFVSPRFFLRVMSKRGGGDMIEGR